MKFTDWVEPWRPVAPGDRRWAKLDVGFSPPAVATGRGTRSIGGSITPRRRRLLRGAHAQNGCVLDRRNKDCAWWWWLVGWGAYPEGAGNAGGRDGRKRFKDQGCKKGKGWEWGCGEGGMGGGGVRRLELYFALDRNMSGKWSENEISPRLCVFHLTDHRLCHPD